MTDRVKSIPAAAPHTNGRAAPETARRGAASVAAGKTPPPPPPVPAGVQRRRELVAEMCKLIVADRAGATSPDPTRMPRKNLNLPANLSPRMRQTLEHLLAGLSEKEAATKMGLSVHTVHVHVKALYKRLNVTSRAELLARILRG